MLFSEKRIIYRYQEEPLLNCSISDKEFDKNFSILKETVDKLKNTKEKIKLDSTLKRMDLLKCINEKLFRSNSFNSYLKSYTSLIDEFSYRGQDDFATIMAQKLVTLIETVDSSNENLDLRFSKEKGAKILEKLKITKEFKKQIETSKYDFDLRIIDLFQDPEQRIKILKEQDITDYKFDSEAILADYDLSPYEDHVQIKAIYHLSKIIRTEDDLKKWRPFIKKFLTNRNDSVNLEIFEEFLKKISTEPKTTEAYFKKINSLSKEEKISLLEVMDSYSSQIKDSDDLDKWLPYIEKYNNKLNPDFYRYLLDDLAKISKMPEDLNEFVKYNKYFKNIHQYRFLGKLISEYIVLDIGDISNVLNTMDTIKSKPQLDFFKKLIEGKSTNSEYERYANKKLRKYEIWMKLYDYEWIEAIKKMETAKHKYLYKKLMEEGLIETPQDFDTWYQTIESLEEPKKIDEFDTHPYYPQYAFIIKLLQKYFQARIPIKNPETLKEWFIASNNMSDMDYVLLTDKIDNKDITDMNSFRSWRKELKKLTETQKNIYNRILNTNDPQIEIGFVDKIMPLIKMIEKNEENFPLDFLDIEKVTQNDQEYMEKCKRIFKIFDSETKYIFFRSIINLDCIKVKKLEDIFKLEKYIEKVKFWPFGKYSNSDFKKIVKKEIKQIKDLKKLYPFISENKNFDESDVHSITNYGRDKEINTLEEYYDSGEANARFKNFPFTISNFQTRMFIGNKMKTDKLIELGNKLKEISPEALRYVIPFFNNDVYNKAEDLEKNEVKELISRINNEKNPILLHRGEAAIKSLIKSKIIKNPKEIPQWLENLKEYRSPGSFASISYFAEKNLLHSIDDLNKIKDTLLEVDKARFFDEDLFRLFTPKNLDQIQSLKPLIEKIKSPEQFYLIEHIINKTGLKIAQEKKDKENNKSIKTSISILIEFLEKTKIPLKKEIISYRNNYSIHNIEDLSVLGDFLARFKNKEQKKFFTIYLKDKQSLHWDEGIDVDQIKIFQNTIEEKESPLSKTFKITENPLVASLLSEILETKRFFISLKGILKIAENIKFINNLAQKNFILTGSYGEMMDEEINPDKIELTKNIKNSNDLGGVKTLRSWGNLDDKKILTIMKHPQWNEYASKIVNLGRINIVNRTLSKLINKLEDIDTAFDALKNIDWKNQQKILSRLVDKKMVSTFPEIERASEKIKKIKNIHQESVIDDLVDIEIANMDNIEKIIQLTSFIKNNLQKEISIIFNSLIKNIDEISKYNKYIDLFNTSKQKWILEELIKGNFIKNIDDISKYKDILSLYAKDVTEVDINKGINLLEKSNDIDYVFSLINGLFYNVQSSNANEKLQKKVLDKFWEYFQNIGEIGITKNSAINISQKNKILESIGFNLLVHGNEEILKGLIDYSLNHRDKIALFLANNLNLKLNYGDEKYEKYKTEIEELLSHHSILPQYPPSKEILKNNKFKAYIYFGEDKFFKSWEGNLFRRREYHWKKEDRGDEFIYIFRGKKRRKGGKRVEIEVIIPKTYENNNEKVFEKMSDPTVGYIQYVGHAGGRNQLSNAIEDARKKYGNKIISQPKIFVGQACWSFKNYAPSIKRIFPYSHYIGTKEISNVVEGQNLFEDILNGVLEEKSWAEIYKKMKKRPHPFEKTKDGKVKNWKIEEYTKGLVASNYVMPDSIENLQTLDSDGDGIPDSRDRQYNLIASTVNYEESCNPSMPGAIEQPQQSLNDQINYVNQYLEKLFKYTSSDVVPFVSVDLYEDSNPAYDIYGWYEGSDDAKQNLVKINSTYVENIEDLRTDSYKEQLQLKISFNHRYMKASPKALTMMAMKEIYEYLYKNIDLEKMNEENEKADGNKDKIIYKDQKELNTEDKEKIFYLSMVDIMRGFHMPQNKDKKDVYENLFLTFKEKYKIPEELTFDMAFQFVWSKKYAGNKETWHEDPDLSPLYQKYQEYNEKIKHPDEMKEDPHFTKYEELKKEKKDNDTIAQILACEELIQKINSLL